MIRNLIDNIKDQNQENIIIEYALAFNFKRSACSKAEKIEYFKRLLFIYGNEYTRKVSNEAKGSLKEYIISICYSTKLNYTENQLVVE